MAANAASQRGLPTPSPGSFEESLSASFNELRVQLVAEHHRHVVAAVRCAVEGVVAEKLVATEESSDIDLNQIIERGGDLDAALNHNSAKSAWQDNSLDNCSTKASSSSRPITRPTSDKQGEAKPKTAVSFTLGGKAPSVQEILSNSSGPSVQADEKPKGVAFKAKGVFFQAGRASDGSAAGNEEPRMEEVTDVRAVDVESDEGEEDDDSDETRRVGTPTARGNMNTSLFMGGVKQAPRHGSTMSLQPTSLQDALQMQTQRQGTGFNLANRQSDELLGKLVFQCLDVWMETGVTNAAAMFGRRRTQTGVPAGGFGKQQTMVDLEATNEKGYVETLIMSPNWFPRIIWDFFGLFFVSYDCVTIPLLVFDRKETVATHILMWFIRMYWTANIVVCFLTSYLRHDGTLESRVDMVARRYMTTWFPIDAIAVSTDWLEVIIGAAVGIKYGFLFRCLRLIRLVRAVRFFKAPELFAACAREYVRSEEVGLMANISKLILIMLAANHVLACMWYGIGLMGDHDDRWVVQSQVETWVWSRQYAIAFHWSLSQFAGELLIEPTNDLERFFTVMVLFLAIIGSAAFVGSLTTAMTQLHMLTSTQASQLSTLRRYLTDHAISRPLTSRVQQNALHALDVAKRHVPECDVELLNLISQPLKVELHFEIYGKHMEVHPFFDHYYEVNPRGVRKVCHTAVKVETIHCGDIVFADCDRATKMFFILNGELHYVRKDTGSNFGPGVYISEAALWTQWTHCGDMRAGQHSQLLVLDPPTFQTIVAEHPTTHARTYAMEYVRQLNDIMPADLEDVHTLTEEEHDTIIALAFPDTWEGYDEDSSEEEDEEVGSDTMSPMGSEPDGLDSNHLPSFRPKRATETKGEKATVTFARGQTEDLVAPNALSRLWRRWSKQGTQENLGAREKRKTNRQTLQQSRKTSRTNPCGKGRLRNMSIFHRFGEACLGRWWSEKKWNARTSTKGLQGAPTQRTTINSARHSKLSSEDQNGCRLTQRSQISGNPSQRATLNSTVSQESMETCEHRFTDRSGMSQNLSAVVPEPSY